MLPLRYQDGSPTRDISSRWLTLLRIVRAQLRECDWRLQCLSEELNACAPLAAQYRKQARDFAAIADQVWTVTSEYALRCRLAALDLRKKAEECDARAVAIPTELARITIQRNRLLEIEPRIWDKQQKARQWHDSQIWSQKP